MYDDIKLWILGGRIFKTNTSEHMLTVGTLQPQEVPPTCWDHMKTYFATKFPNSRSENDSVLVVVYKLSKRVVFTKKTVNAEYIVHLFWKYVLYKHGGPNNLMSHRYPRFTTEYWPALTTSLVITRNLSTSDHPQNGRTTVEFYPGTCCNASGNHSNKPVIWDRYFPELEFELNASRHQSTKLTLFEIYIGPIP